MLITRKPKHIILFLYHLFVTCSLNYLILKGDFDFSSIMLNLFLVFLPLYFNYFFYILNRMILLISYNERNYIQNLIIRYYFEEIKFSNKISLKMNKQNEGKKDKIIPEQKSFYKIFWFFLIYFMLFPIGLLILFFIVNNEFHFINLSAEISAVLIINNLINVIYFWINSFLWFVLQQDLKKHMDSSYEFIKKINSLNDEILFWKTYQLENKSSSEKESEITNKINFLIKEKEWLTEIRLKK